MMTRSRQCLLALLLLLMPLLPVAAQTPQEKTALRTQRFSKIDFYHVGAGVDLGVNENLMVAPKIYVGVGSYRKVLCADVGMKLLRLNPTGPADKERVSMWQLPVFVTVSANVLRWQQNAIYFGGELDYHLKLGAGHHLAEGDVTVSDDKLACNHASAGLRLGLRLNRWDVSLFCERDLAPAIDQKRIYESPDYDYDALHDAIFERLRFGVTLSYLFPL